MAAPEFREQDVRQPRFGAGPVEDGLKELLGVADAPEDRARGDDRRLLERQELGRRRSEGEQAAVERAHALVGKLEPEPRRGDDLRPALPNSVTSAYSPASTV